MSNENGKSSAPSASRCYASLEQWIDDNAVEAVADMIDTCPAEILAIGAALMNLDISTRDHAGDLAADGFVFRTEEAEERANRYRETLAEITRIWSA